MNQNKISIYIADDDQDDRDFLIEVLKSRGFYGVITLFEHGEHLINHLNARRDCSNTLIILDINMPVKDGYQTLKELKANAILQTIPVIILTASTKQKEEEHCRELGCSAFMRKPLTMAGYEDLAEYIIHFSATAEALAITE